MSSYDDAYSDQQSVKNQTNGVSAANVIELHAQQRSEDQTIAWPSHNQLPSNALAVEGQEPLSADHFISRNGVEFAGTHLILDLWGASKLDDLDQMEQAMREAVSVAGATLLHIHLHHFTPNGGISGVAVLAESHISVHTWPERNFAAFDIFMCGDAKPEKAIPVLKSAFKPTSVNVSEHLRGTVLSDSSNDE